MPKSPESFLSEEQKMKMEKRAKEDTELINIGQISGGSSNEDIHRYRKERSAELVPDERGNYRLEVSKRQLEWFKERMEADLSGRKTEQALAVMLDALKSADNKDETSRLIKDFARRFAEEQFAQEKSQILREKNIEEGIARVERFLSAWINNRVRFSARRHRDQGDPQYLGAGTNDIISDHDLELGEELEYTLVALVAYHPSCFQLCLPNGHRACFTCRGSERSGADELEFDKLRKEIYGDKAYEDRFGRDDER